MHLFYWECASPELSEESTLEFETTEIFNNDENRSDEYEFVDTLERSF